MKNPSKYVGIWLNMGLSRFFKIRRLEIIDSLVDNRILKENPVPIKILEVGCATGKDFVRFFPGRKDLQITGIDLVDRGLRQDNFTMIVGDGENIGFPDKYFDIAITIGVLEHIRPFEKLAKVVSEIDRVSKTFVHLVPSIDSLIEPHLLTPLWHLRKHSSKRRHDSLIYLSDEGWLSFRAFEGAEILRYSYIPLLLRNNVIWKKGE